MVSSTTGGVTASTVTCRRVPRLAGVVAVRIVEMPDAVLLSGVAMVTSTTTLAARTPMATVEGSTSKTAAIEYRKAVALNVSIVPAMVSEVRTAGAMYPPGGRAGGGRSGDGGGGVDGGGGGGRSGDGGGGDGGGSKGGGSEGGGTEGKGDGGGGGAGDGGRGGGGIGGGRNGKGDDGIGGEGGAGGDAVTVTMIF